jgi:hypothetical protein
MLIPMGDDCAMNVVMKKFDDDEFVCASLGNTEVRRSIGTDEVEVYLGDSADPDFQLDGDSADELSICLDYCLSGRHPSDDDDTLSSLKEDDCVDGVLERAKESEGLEPIPCALGMIGYEEHINGPGATLVDFQPTRAELMTLAWDYLKRYVSVETFQATGNTGSFEIRESAFCWRRFESICEALSPGKPIPEFEEFITQQSKEIDEIRRETEERDRLETEKDDRQT